MGTSPHRLGGHGRCGRRDSHFCEPRTCGRRPAASVVRGGTASRPSSSRSVASRSAPSFASGGTALTATCAWRISPAAGSTPSSSGCKACGTWLPRSGTTSSGST